MRTFRFLSLAVLISGSMLHAPASDAANGGAAIRVVPSGYVAPTAIVAQPDSGALVVYSDENSSLYAQRVDRHGQPMWPNGGILVKANLIPQYTLDVVPDGSGGCVLAWQEDRGVTGMDVLVQRVLPGGTLGYAPSGLVICDAIGTQGEPQLVVGDPGFFYVIWKDERTTGPSASDIYAQRVSVEGAASWAANGLRVNSASTIPSAGVGGGGRPSVCSDMQGGIQVAWTVNLGAVQRAQRMNATGSLLWGSSGASYGAVGDYSATIRPDGTGGAWVVYNHVVSAPTGYPYLMHLHANGSLLFAGNGVDLAMGLSSGQFNSYEAQPVRNASGGCFVYGIGWNNSSSVGVRRQEVSAAGALLRGSGESVASSVTNFELTDLGNSIALSLIIPVPPRTRAQMRRYAYDGTALYPGQGVYLGRDEPALYIYPAPPAALPNGVMMVAFYDNRYANPLNPYRFGAFGQAYGATGEPLWDDAELPTLVSVPDAPGDQGGWVRTNWNAGVGDYPGGAVTEYLVWRSVPAAQAVRIAHVAPSAREGRFAFEGRTLLAHASAFWEMVGSQPAARLAAYALTVPTGQDSMAGSSADASFMVEARDDSSHIWWSGVLTGHSVDNLPPPAPSPAAGYYEAGSTTLYWGGSSVPDLCCYEVFRGGSPGFTPSDANRVGTTTEVTFTDVGSPAFYRIAARDIHGNLGPSVLVVPGNTTDVGEDAPRVWRLTASWRAGTLALALDVPQADEGRIEVFDVAGRRLWSEPFHTRGPQALTRSIGNGEAALPGGVVFVRVRAASGHSLLARAVILR